MKILLRLDNCKASFLFMTALLFLLSGFSAYAEKGPQYRPWASQAMGRTGIANSQGTGALFLNPSQLAGNEGGGFQLYTDVGVNGVLLDYADWVSSNYKYLNSLDSLLQRIEPIDSKWAPFAQSFVIGGQYDDFALALVADVRYDLALSKAVLTPVPGVGAFSDLIATAGRGFDGPGGYRFGIAAKYLYRVELQNQLIGITDDRFYTVYQTWRKPNDGLSSVLEKLQIAGDIAETKQGVGLNLGVTRAINENLTAGASFQDLPGILGGELIKPQLNLGIAWHRDFSWLDGMSSGLTGTFDWQNFLIPGTPWFKQFKTGASISNRLTKKVNNLEVPGREVLFLGMGLNDGYPSFGIRFGYWAYLSYLYITEETGTYPGQRPLTFHKLSLEMDL